MPFQPFFAMKSLSDFGNTSTKKSPSKGCPKKPDGSASSEAVSAFCAASSPPSDAAGGDAAKTAARLSMVAVLSPALKQREGSMRSGLATQQGCGRNPNTHTQIYIYRYRYIYIHTHQIPIVICVFYIYILYIYNIYI